ncbi:MAG: tRNA pseudouridine(55) synthase TruB [candidate division FCPU426 bacterium]
MNGLLLIDKPAGPTSHDVVDKVRDVLKERKIGHAGTLDPQATGLLLLALGDATRWLEFLPGDKRYSATLRLGVETDTEDIWGKVLKESDPAALSGIADEAIREALESVKRSGVQVPPMVSALKHQGKPLYEWARQGKEIERKARPVEIHSIQIGERRGNELDIEVHCGSGTYVRSLCAEAGRVLGCGAAMAALRRTAVGPFRVEDAVAPDRAAEGRLLGASEALGHLKEFRVPEGSEKALCSGQDLGLEGPAWTESDTWRLCAQDGALLALGRPQQVSGAWRMRPKKVFAAR